MVLDKYLPLIYLPLTLTFDSALFLFSTFNQETDGPPGEDGGAAHASERSRSIDLPPEVVPMPLGPEPHVRTSPGLGTAATDAHVGGGTAETRRPKGPRRRRQIEGVPDEGPPDVSTLVERLVLQKHRARSATVCSPEKVVVPKPEPPQERAETPPPEWSALDGEAMMQQPGIMHHNPPAPAPRPWHAPSTCTRPVIHKISDGVGRVVGGSIINQLYADRLMGKREVRTKIPPQPANLRAMVEDRMMKSKGESRWQQLSGTWKQYMAWCEHHSEDGQELPTEWTIVMWVESKLLDKSLKSNGSAVKYVKNLVQSVFMTGATLDTRVIEEYKEALRKGGMRPCQAPPAAFEDIVAALGLLTESEQIGLIIAWLTASRIDEIQYLRKEHVECQADGLFMIDFPRHKGDQFKLGTAMPTYAGTWAAKLSAYLDNLPTGAKLSDLTTDRAAAILNRVREGLSAHSVKRGALVVLLRAGVPLAIIQAVAKHRDLEMTLAYLPRMEVAMHLGLHEATRMLGNPSM